MADGKVQCGLSALASHAHRRILFVNCGSYVHATCDVAVSYAMWFVHFYILLHTCSFIHMIQIDSDMLTETIVEHNGKASAPCPKTEPFALLKIVWFLWHLKIQEVQPDQFLGAKQYIHWSRPSSSEILGLVLGKLAEKVATCEPAFTRGCWTQNLIVWFIRGFVSVWLVFTEQVVPASSRWLLCGLHLQTRFWAPVLVQLILSSFGHRFEPPLEKSAHFQGTVMI